MTPKGRKMRNLEAECGYNRASSYEEKEIQGLWRP